MVPLDLRLVSLGREDRDELAGASCSSLLRDGGIAALHSVVPLVESSDTDMLFGTSAITGTGSEVTDNDCGLSSMSAWPVSSFQERVVLNKLV